MQLAIFAACLVVWVFFLRVFSKSDLSFWRFIWGSLGLFIIGMVFIRPLVTQPLAQSIAAIAGVVGQITGTFEAFFRYGIIYVASGDSSITLQVDMECSGIIEIMAFLCLLAFYRVYSVSERITIGLAGTLAIILFNSLRIVVICLIVYFCGVESYGVAHTYIGRFLFYGLTVCLYFYVFTRPQIKSMKVGELQHGSTS